MPQAGERRPGIVDAPRVGRRRCAVPHWYGQKRHLRQLGEISARAHLRGTSDPATTIADFVKLPVSQWGVVEESCLDVVVIHHGAVARRQLEHGIASVVRIANELATVMAEEAPMSVARGRRKISVLDYLLARAIRVAHDAHVVQQHHAVIQQTNSELVPQYVAEALAG